MVALMPLWARSNQMVRQFESPLNDNLTFNLSQKSAPSPLNYFKTAFSSYAIVVAVSVSTDDHFFLNFCSLVLLNIVCLVIFHLVALFVILLGHDGILLLKCHLTFCLHNRTKLWAGILGITMLIN